MRDRAREPWMMLADDVVVLQAGTSQAFGRYVVWAQRLIGDGVPADPGVKLIEPPMSEYADTPYVLVGIKCRDPHVEMAGIALDAHALGELAKFLETGRVQESET